MDSETKKKLIATKQAMKELKNLANIISTGSTLVLAVIIIYNYETVGSWWVWNWKMGIGIGLFVLSCILNGYASSKITEIEQKLSE